MTTSADATAALRDRPWRFFTSSWPWRSVVYLLTTVVIGLPAGIVLLSMIMVGVATSVLGVGLVVLGSVPLLVGVLGVVERRRLMLILGRTDPGAGLRDRLRAGRQLAVSWPEFGYALLLGSALWIADLVVLVLAVAVPLVLVCAPWLAAVDRLDVAGWQIDPGTEAWAAALVGVLSLVVSAYVTNLVAIAQAAVAKALLAPREEQLEQALVSVKKSRVDLVDAFETERRRIERDLHDGVQQRLVALTMTLGRAELNLPDGNGLETVQQAHRQAEDALIELRRTVRGIHPRVLVDHGLAAAVHELADHAAIPVLADIQLPGGRLPPTIEQTAYFVVSESLTNVARHAHAQHVAVHGWRHDGIFLLTVEDDGAGGASQDGHGTGLAGLELRLQVLGGALTVSSPPGGPTQIRMECPCPQ